ncbi:MAG: trypsin-like peptidase domain-containing protein [Ramlibacter sp.]
MNAASRVTLHLAFAAAAGYAGAAYHLHTHALAAQPSRAGIIVHTSGAGAVAAPAAGPMRASYRDAALRAGASVVTVYCASARAGASGAIAVASGVVVARDGLVVTTSEVAGHAENVLVTLPDGTRRSARFLGADPGAGLAFLKVDGAALEPIEMAGRETSAVGDTVLALGDALGLGSTVTQGIISAIRPAELQAGGAKVDFIQTDASIHSGNFGGALVDTAGRLIGITVGTLGADGADSLAFAVPAERVAQAMAQLRHAARAEPVPPQVAPERGRFTEVSYPGTSRAR